ncbi:MAG: hypothetical protein JJU34_14615 [Lunatimonas sp.]|uniref:hypothetical protein n=1 Tax=Lunatimonas sp. TaxID=2060141 RepID=UPI00263A518C|nr:hypothetical protein [Lunatimonas sp.]MCC5938509.1 hypothetical protein [Lunatimonas sp.]
MKKDIPFHPVTGVKMAIARSQKDAGADWAVYIINKNLISLQTLMITSKGYGQLEGEKKQTSTLRHLIQELEATSVAKVEIIDPKLFSLTNEFWVSYYIMNQIFDKKFIFVQGSMEESNIRYIPELDLFGVLHV